MDNKWNFKIDLENDEVFKAIGEKYGVEFPEALKEFIIQNNAASPDADCIVIDGIERVYGETLSFNEEETEASTFNDAKFAVEDNQYLPFAIDPFGNYFCYSLTTDTIVFYDCEENTYSDSNLNLNEFIRRLYKGSNE
ncbi:MAG: SMI1/KNR4 family protein [Eubacterium sp.]|nr:SMI1/KNR4 family protein [Eubacterium sp.]